MDFDCRAWKQNCKKAILSLSDMKKKQDGLVVSQEDALCILGYANSYGMPPKEESISGDGKVFLDCISLLAGFCVEYTHAEYIDLEIYLTAVTMVGKLLIVATVKNSLRASISRSAILNAFVAISKRQDKNSLHKKMNDTKIQGTIQYFHTSLGITFLDLHACWQATNSLFKEYGRYSSTAVISKCFCNYSLICKADGDDVARCYRQEALQLSLSLMFLGEYERAALICLELLGYTSDAFDIYANEGLKPLGKNAHLGEEEKYLTPIRIILARTLLYISNRCETVARADVPPYALKRVVAEEATISPRSTANDYHIFASMLRRIAITELNHIGFTDGEATALAGQLMGFLKLALWEDSAKQVGERDCCLLRETYSKCLGNASSSADRISAALALKALFVHLSTPEDPHFIGTDFEENLCLLIACFDGRYAARDSEDPFLSAFFDDYAVLLKMCSRLLTHSKDMGEDGRSQARKLLLETIRVAVCSIEIRRSRICSFPAEEDYISSMPSKRRVIYDVLNQLLNKSNSPWKDSISNDEIRAFRQAHRRCGDEQPIQTRSKVSYYTTLNTAQYLFDTLYRIDERRCPVSMSELSSLSESDKPSTMCPDADNGKNCLTVMHASYMNDPYEGVSLLRHLHCEALRPFLSDWQDVQTRIIQGSMTFLKSFTTLYDQLHMWSLYGSDKSIKGDCDGCCVCFSRDMFVQKRDNATRKGMSAFDNDNEARFPVDDHNLYRVVYMDEKDVPAHPDSEEENLLWYLNEIKGSLEAIDELIKEQGPEQLAPDAPLPSFGLSENELRNYLIDVLTPTAFLIKDVSYSKEEEMRLLLRRDLSDGSDSDICTIPSDPSYRSKICVRPFEQVYIDRIILGPKFPNPHEVIPQLMIKLADMKKKAVRDGVRMEGAVRLSRINYQ